MANAMSSLKKNVKKNISPKMSYSITGYTLELACKYLYTEVSCQVNKNLKIREKLGLVRPHRPTPLSIFLKHLETNNTKKNTKHTQNFPTKK